MELMLLMDGKKDDIIGYAGYQPEEKKPRQRPEGFEHDFLRKLQAVGLLHGCSLVLQSGWPQAVYRLNKPASDEETRPIRLPLHPAAEPSIFNVLLKKRDEPQTVQDKLSLPLLRESVKKER